MRRSGGSIPGLQRRCHFGFPISVASLLALGVVIASSCALLTNHASAATVTSERVNGLLVIHIDGRVEMGDADRFKSAVAEARAATVVLASPGGILSEGLQIGEMIRERGFGTVVKEGEACASACGFIWLGGTRKSVEKDGRVGFHAVYLGTEGNPVSSDGNALAGAYMARLGYTDLAIIYATEAPPSDIRWLTPKDAKFLEIDVAWGSSVTTETSPSTLPAERVEEMLLQRGSVALLKQRAPNSYRALAKHVMTALDAGKGWRMGYLDGIRAISTYGAELSKDGLQESVYAATIELYPREVMDLLVYRPSLWAEKVSVHRCATFGSTEDFATYLNSIIFLVGDSKPGEMHEKVVSMTEKVLLRAMSQPPPKLKPLTRRESNEAKSKMHKIGQQWVDQSSKSIRKLADKQPFDKWPDAAKCEYYKYLFHAASKDVRLSRLILTEQLRPSPK